MCVCVYVCVAMHVEQVHVAAYSVFALIVSDSCQHSEVVSSICFSRIESSMDSFYVGNYVKLMTLGIVCICSFINSFHKICDTDDLQA